MCSVMGSRVRSVKWDLEAQCKVGSRVRSVKWIWSAQCKVRTGAGAIVTLILKALLSVVARSDLLDQK